MAQHSKQNRRMRGFERASSLVQSRIRKAGESRGFAVSKLLTHWTEIAGEEIARVARPVNVSYARGGFGATLTVLTTGAHAPLVQMQSERLREKVNACYGYNAIKRVRVTQTAPTGFSEGQVQFDPAPAPKTTAAPSALVTAKARQSTATVEDDGLRDALERLGANILSKDPQA